MGATLYTGGVVGLGTIWYEDLKPPFRFFNDNRQWLQMDKLGHFYSAYHLGRLGQDLLRPTRLSPAAKRWLGGGMGFLLLLPIEILDGFSPDYGASWGDLGANLLGSLLVISGQKRVQPKFSFWPSRWAEQRPDLLGDHLLAQMLKDYNGQRYWLSVRVKSWWMLSLGYSAEGMVYGDPHQNRAMGYTAYRQYYLSLDLDLSGIKPRSAFLKTLLWIGQGIKIPAPALGWQPNRGWRVYPLFF
ncbi:MAG: DUF2279 domain-containing protein [Bernardetiaceae bacterium]